MVCSECTAGATAGSEWGEIVAGRAGCLHRELLRPPARGVRILLTRSGRRPGVRLQQRRRACSGSRFLHSRTRPSVQEGAHNSPCLSGVSAQGLVRAQRWPHHVRSAKRRDSPRHGRLVRPQPSRGPAGPCAAAGSPPTAAGRPRRDDSEVQHGLLGLRAARIVQGAQRAGPVRFNSSSSSCAFLGSRR